MNQLIVHAGDFKFDARFEEQLAPKTCAAFRRAMPFESQMVHVRWSGEASGCRSAISISASATRTTRAIRRRARSSSIPAASARPRSCWPTARCTSPARWARLAGNHLRVDLGARPVRRRCKTVL